jgi:hypothetical protein
MHLAPAPRHVPPSLAIANLFGLLGQIGWGVFAFSSIFFWTFVMNADLSFVTMRGELHRAAGRITEVRRTGASEGNSPVMEHRYEFSVAGRPYTGVSYVTGSETPPGQSVDVEFAEGTPEKSRIVGMRRAMFGPGVVFVIIFPLIGLAVLWFGFKMGAKRNALLKNGLVAMGTLVDKAPTNTSVNRQTVWELTFEFTTRDGRKARTKALSHQPQRMEDEAQEALLYDPANPERAYVLDEAPSRPKIDMTGALQGNPVRAVLALILPAIAIAVNVLFVMARL